MKEKVVQGRHHPKLEVPRTDMSRSVTEPGHDPDGNRTRASTVGGEHHRKEPFEQLDNSYSEHERDSKKILPPPVR